MNWVASAWKKLDERPALVSKSFEVTGITVNKDNESVRNEEIQKEIATALILMLMLQMTAKRIVKVKMRTMKGRTLIMTQFKPLDFNIVVIFLIQSCMLF